MQFNTAATAQQDVSDTTDDQVPVEWTYGGSCGGLNDDYCDGSCDCRWSWPVSSDWSDPDAACRCQLGDGEDEGTIDDIDIVDNTDTTDETTVDDWTFGGACASQSDDYCDGSCECNWSWPTTGSWDDTNAACRC